MAVEDTARKLIIVGSLCLLLAPPSVSLAAKGDWLGNAARVAEDSGDDRRAIQILRALRQITEDPSVSCRLGRLLEGVNRWTEAFSAYENCLRSKTANRAETQKRLDVTRQRAQATGHEDMVDKPLQLTELARKAFDIGRKRALAKDYDSGIRHLEAAVLLDPKMPGPHRVLGAAYLKIGRTKAGQKHLANYLRIRPAGRLAGLARKMLRGKGVLGKLRLRASFKCEVWVNGQFMAARTPVNNLLLPAGVHIIALHSARFHILRAYRVDVVPTKTKTIDFRFGAIKVRLRPWGRIRADGADLGLWDEIGLPAGEHALVVTSHDKKRRVELRWKVKAGKIRELQWPAPKR